MRRLQSSFATINRKTTQNKRFLNSMAESCEEESAVGITNYANTAIGFSGILKQRYSDFVVREVSKSGIVSRLIDISGTELENKWFPKDEINEEPVLSDTASDKVIRDIQAILPAEIQLNEKECADIKSFIVACIDMSDDCPAVYLGIPAPDKTVRTAIHGLFKKELSQFIDSDTMQDNNVSKVRLVAKHKNKGAKIDMKFKRAPTWPKGLGDYLQFTLFKENIDTMSAINVINKSIRVKPNGIGYNGTKDKRGVTAQKCTVYRKKPSDFARINSYPHVPTIRVGDFEYVTKECGLGDLTGESLKCRMCMTHHYTLII